jgi:heme-degrading monooxygenase HmoA
MIELHIYLEPFAGKENEVEKVFRDAFIPAISVQDGFRRVAMLKVRDALRQYRIVLAFDSEEMRLKWVASPEHQVAFPKIIALCQQITWAGFDVVEQRLGKAAKG